MPRDPLGPILSRSAGLRLRPSQVPAQLAPDNELRADMQAELGGNAFGAPVGTSQMVAQPAQLPAQHEGFSSPATLGLLSHVRPKLVVGQINDPLEDEADRIADEVMRTPEPQIAGVSPQISRKCYSCEEEKEEAQQVQAKRDGSGTAAGDAPAVVTALLQSPGRPLESGVRGFMEPRLGYELSDVRIHTGPLASRSAEAVMARAYTVGRSVVFRHGEYAPDTTEGRRLLVHELAHVLQQSPANPAPKMLRPSQVSVVGSRVQRQDDAPQPNTYRVDYQRRSVVTESHARMQSAFVNGATTIKNFGALVKVLAPIFKVGGSVTVTNDAVNSGEYEVGFVQAMRSSSGLIGHYYTGKDADGLLDASGDPYMQSRQDYTALPARDGEPNLTPWYGPEAMRPVTGLVTEVSMSDQPQGGLVMETPDHMAALGQVMGTEQFISWLAIRHAPSGTLTPLWYITWSVDYAVAVDPKSSEGTPFGLNTVDELAEGTGPIAPITSGPVVNDLRGKAVWSTWS